MEQVRAKKSDSYSETITKSKKCEAELAVLFHNPIPQNDDELEPFVLKKMELDSELKHLRMIKD